jgi:segregation and condensation protein B
VTDLRRVVEALLFAADIPIRLDKIVEICGGPDSRLRAGRAEIRETIKDLSRQYSEVGSAFAITEVAGGWQLYCKPEFSKWIRELHKGRVPSKLSQAALETLAIIAYKQPIVRAEIEAVRGVDSSGVLSTLLKRNVVAIAGRAPGMGRALMYRTTKEFLRYFGLSTITDLPRLEEFSEVLGLPPGELAMTINGAEHLAGVAAVASEAENAAGDEAHAAGITSPAESEFGDGAEAIQEQAPAPSSAEHSHSAGKPHLPDTALDAAETDPAEAGPPCCDDSMHAIEDRKLIDPLDEA